MCRFFLRGCYARFPKQSAVRAIKGEKRAAIVRRLGYENTIGPDNWRRITALPQRHTPLHVIGGAPLDRDILFLANASAERSPPGRPVRRADPWGKQEM